MAFKFIAFATLVAAANAGLLPAVAPLSYTAAAPLSYSAPVAVAAAPLTKTVIAKTIDADYDPRPQYSYAYDVHDSLTGDAKSQQESRDGDVVQGSYSLIEADGTRRIVDYTADSVNGFNAVVRKEPATVAVKTIAAAPLVHAAPLAYAAPAPVLAAPIAKIATPIAHGPTLAYSAPVAKFAAPIAQAPAFAYAAPIAKYAAAPLAYAAPSATYVH